MFKKFRESMRTSFSSRLAFTLIFLNVILFICFAVVKGIMLQITSESEINKKMDSALSVSVYAVSDYAESKLNAAKTASEHHGIVSWLLDEADSAAVRTATADAAVNDPDIMAVWIMRDMDGEFIANEISGFSSLSACSWYSYYNHGGRESVFTLSSSGVVSNCACVTMVYPIIDNENIIGFAGAEVGLDAVSRRFSSFNLSDGCYIMIGTENGDIIYNPADAAPDRFSSEDMKTVFAYPNGMKGNIYSRSTVDPYTSWKVMAVFDKKGANEALLTDYSRELLLLIGLLVLMIIAVINIVRIECREIPAISQSIAEISAGNYNFRINSSCCNEIGLIAESVDTMAKTLQDNNALIDSYVNLDTLTGISNRIKMYEAIDDLIVSRDHTQPRFALIFIDIDNFRWINETLGHRYGDEVLKTFADRLRTVFRRAYRYSSDMFVALVEIGNDTSAADELINRFRSELNFPFNVFATNLYVRCSAGIAVYPDDGDTPDILLQDADIALNRSKERGKDRVSYYNTALHSSVNSKTSIAQNLAMALERGEFYLNYQPIISTADGSIHGFEVLLRWESETLGYVPPSKFVQIAEETGDIVSIGTWIFETACRFLKRLNEYNSDIILSINVSPVQMKKHDYMEHIHRVLNITKVNPENIQVEITESSLIDFMETGQNVIEEINSLGIALALDDFGTGYSSLNYLKNFPIKCLKVDKSFVDDIDSHGKDYRITGSIIDLVHGLGIKTVAEGVETVSQYNSIVNMKCDYIQGFLMSKPMDEHNALEFVRMYDQMHKPDKAQLERTERVLAEERRMRSINKK